MASVSVSLSNPCKKANTASVHRQSSWLLEATILPEFSNCVKPSLSRVDSARSGKTLANGDATELLVRLHLWWQREISNDFSVATSDTVGSLHVKNCVLPRRQSRSGPIFLLPNQVQAITWNDWTISQSQMCCRHHKLHIMCLYFMCFFRTATTPPRLKGERRNGPDMLYELFLWK